MARCVALPIRIGHKAAEPISKEFQALYLAVAGWFIDGPVELFPDGLNTIPVPIEGGAAIASAAVRRVLAEAKPELAIVDLANSMRRILPPYSIVSSVMGAFPKLEKDGPTRVVFLVNSQFWDADPAFEPIRPLLEVGVASVLSDDGTLRGTVRPATEFNSAAYLETLAAARTSPLLLLKRKLVRQHGHFKRHRDGAHSHCVSFFFDGRNCTTELTELITTHFTENEGSSSERELLFHAPDSPWLSGAAEAASIRLGLPLRRINLEAEDIIRDQSVSDAPIILVPMCDTGQTLERVIRKLRELNVRCTPSILSVLSTEGFDEHSGRRMLYVDGFAFEVNYLLKVDQPHYSLQECRQCRIGTPESLPEHPGHDDPEISTFAMWSMILEAGLKVEDDVPAPSRPSLGLVPDFPAVIQRNGPYLAAKMHAELGRMKGRLPRNPIIICPDEKGARALSDALTSVYKYTVVRVPGESLRKDINEFTENEKNEDWYVQLASLSRGPERTNVIALDEFNASAGTRIALKRLATNFGLGITCYMSLFDFNPELRTKMDARVYSLYSIDWLEGYTRVTGKQYNVE